MFSFIERLALFLQVLADGKEELDDAPMHPPIAYADASAEGVVSMADCPYVGNAPWLGAAIVRTSAEGPKVIVDYQGLPNLRAGPGSLAAPAFLLPTKLPHEFPTSLNDLLVHLRQAGVSDQAFRRAIGECATMNPENSPTYVVIGTPMRTNNAGSVVQHLAIWSIDGEESNLVRKLQVPKFRDKGLKELLLNIGNRVWSLLGTKLSWCRVLEARPEAVARRDSQTLADYVRGKKVMVWGCGALGGPISVHLARMGVVSIALYDNKCVSPGIIGRQPYDWSDIGYSKADCLGKQIQRIAPDLAVSSSTQNVLSLMDADDWFKGVDILIDATANLAVSQRIEESRGNTRARDLDIISVGVSAECQAGIVRAAVSGSREGPWAIDRRAKLRAAADQLAYLDALWPEVADGLFQPEPGCSDPTFRGSSVDVGAMAAQLLNAGLAFLNELDGNESTGFSLVPQSAVHTLQIVERLENPKRLSDQMDGWSIHLSRRAHGSMQQEIESMARRKPKAETGGILLGEISTLTKTVYIDVATGPPTDSRCDVDRFVCGINGVSQLVEDSRTDSRGSLQFLGIWHSHPRGLSQQSTTDFSTMCRSVLESQPDSKLALMIIQGGKRHDLSAYMYNRSSLLRGGIVAAVSSGTHRKRLVKVNGKQPRR